MDLIELQNKIYAQNVTMGWHDEPRSFSTFACLFHSELSKAMEGLRKNLMDDKLPHYPMFQVELADFVIRCLDWLGLIRSKGDHASIDHRLYGANLSWSETDLLACLHCNVSDAYTCIGDDFTRIRCIERAVAISFSYAKYKKWDLLAIINEKLEFNKSRPDHKRENRAKINGKKF